jgi:methyl-accepting chemotaxis protein
MESQHKKGIQLRLIFGFAAAPLIMIILNVIGVVKVNSIESGLTTINEVNSVKQRFAINFRGSVHDRAISLRDVVLNSDPSKINESIEEIKKLEGFYKDSALPLDKIFTGKDVSPEEVALLKDIKAIEEQTLPLITKVIDAKLSSNNDLAWKILMEDAKPAFKTWLGRINKFIDQEENSNVIESKKAREIASGFQQLMLQLTVFSLIVTIILGYFITRSIIKPLVKVASDLDSSSKQITSVSETISDSSKTLAEGSKNQATAIDAISTSLKEMNTTIQLSADNSLNAARLASESKESAKSGEVVVKQMHEAIVDIKSSNTNIMNQIEDSNNKISEIVTLIVEIGNKTKVIDDIVFQTKLLSFNAAVEAARAGESGKGFAVVAEEVGNLAQMSGKASKEISDMLSVSRQKVEAIVSDTRKKVSALVENGQIKVEVGLRIANQCAEVLNQIVSKVSDVTRMAEEISRSAREQSIGFKVITENIGDMDEVTQRNAEVASETSETLQSLNVQAIEMRKSFHELSELIDRDVPKAA